MKTIAILTSFILFAVLLNISQNGFADEQVVHHGEVVDSDVGPDGCIACHDGLVASEVHYCTVECGFRSPHSIYKEYPPMAKQSEFASVESLREKGIRLNNGRIGCVSCHDLKNQAPDHLVMDNSRSSLCFGCHIK